MAPRPLRLDFPGPSGATLSARLDMPMELPKAYALFAHCFTCSKDILAARAIAKALTEAGLAVLRFDFTGLGNSGGDFASTNFSMNLGDLKAAADYLREHYEAPSLLVGHSLGGAAVIAVAQDLPEVKAVATIAAPSDVTHVSAQFGDKLDEIREQGEAEVSLGNRPFRIQKQFLDDMGKHDVTTAAATLKRALLILHSPTDNTVGISNATDIFVAAKHPKSFASLDNADHLLSRAKDATYAANVIAAWAGRYLNIERDPSGPADHEDPEVIVKETGQGTFQNLIRTGPHHFLADEPTDVGGLGSGPSPYDLLCAALGTCTTM
ncbi:MAG: alpha/beta fold hydrolase, partial [Pseudomonadota bacterium]